MQRTIIPMDVPLSNKTDRMMIYASISINLLSFSPACPTGITSQLCFAVMCVHRPAVKSLSTDLASAHYYRDIARCKPFEAGRANPFPLMHPHALAVSDNAAFGTGAMMRYRLVVRCSDCIKAPRPTGFAVKSPLPAEYAFMHSLAFSLFMANATRSVQLVCRVAPTLPLYGSPSFCLPGLPGDIGRPAIKIHCNEIIFTQNHMHSPLQRAIGCPASPYR